MTTTCLTHSSLIDSPQLPVSAYFDTDLFQKESAMLFNQRAKYLGHRACIPEIGDYYTLAQEQHARVLIHSNQGIELVSNICRHRQAIMLNGRGSLLQNNHGNIVCPIHRWTYSGVGTEQPLTRTGQLLGAPHFEKNPCLNLKNTALQEWNGLLFEKKQVDINHDLAQLSVRSTLDFNGYVFDKVEQHICNYNWKTFIEVYLEDYHVGPFHPGLGSFVTCDDLNWEFGNNHSVQTVGVAPDLKNQHPSAYRSGSPNYQKWIDTLLTSTGEKVPHVGAIWFLYYPGIMVEHYPNLLTVSTVHPIAVDKTLNIVEFYHPEEIQAFERELVLAQQNAYMETCVEDDEIAERMDAGRKALYQRGDNEVGPYQSPMEDGMRHFHQWYRGQMHSFL